MPATYSGPVMPITGYDQPPNMMRGMPNAAGYGYSYDYGYDCFGGAPQPMDDTTYGYRDQISSTAVSINCFVARLKAFLYRSAKAASGCVW
jgi:hypothetical protein